jgi:hypothetical protein
MRNEYSIERQSTVHNHNVPTRKTGLAVSPELIRIQHDIQKKSDLYRHLYTSHECENVD